MKHIPMKSIRAATGALAVMLAIVFGMQIASAGTLAAGTTITANLSSNDINTRNAYVGQPFSMTVVQPYPNGDSSYAGAAVYGHVSNVVSAGQGRKAYLGLTFDKITLRNGRSAHLSGHVVAAATKEQNMIARDAIGAGVGMVVGNYIGKHVGTNLGGLVGAGGGYLYASNMKANLNLAKGAQVQLQLNHSVAPALRQAGH
jgi:hypothetical protein